MRTWLFDRIRKRANSKSEIPIPANPQGAFGINILVLGNCQARQLAACLQALSRNLVANSVEVQLTALQAEFAAKSSELQAALGEYDYILCQPLTVGLVTNNFPEFSAKIRMFPPIVFSGYHPDLVYLFVDSDQSYLRGPLDHYHSAIAFWGYVSGLSPKETARYFNDAVYQRLGYFEHWNTSRELLVADGKSIEFPLTERFSAWSSNGCFMYSTNHPKLPVMADIGRDVLSKLGVPTLPDATEYLSDELANGPIWPVYPEIGDRLGLAGNYNFKIERSKCPPDRPVMMLSLREFLEASFLEFAKYNQSDLKCDRLGSGRFEGLRGLGQTTRRSGTLPSKPHSGDSTNEIEASPYTALSSQHFWKSSVTDLSLDKIDPVTAGFEITHEMKVATAGSCFAQHIAKALQRFGLGYYIAESANGISAENQRRMNYGVYSARYGNVYTAAQLRQLLERAIGKFETKELVWQRRDGRYVDPFRPQITPEGYPSTEAVFTDRKVHLSAVREMFCNLDVFIFTLGLTEAWRSKTDGAVFPLAPGVAGGEVDFDKIEFVNFRVHEVVADLVSFVHQLNELNSRAKVILTVSPVPLAATYAAEHVLAANAYSKAVLRVAAAEVCAQFRNCSYFPSLELISGHHTRGSFYKSDSRTVTLGGVEHVMGLFLEHYSPGSIHGRRDADLTRELHTIKEVFCDEEAIDQR
jgi:hypothetical protein